MARLVSYPFRAAVGRHDPVYFPRDGLPFRFVGLSGGVFGAKGDDGFRTLSLNAEQRAPFLGFLIAHILVNGGSDQTTVTSVNDFGDDHVGPFGQVAFYIGERFVSENTVRHLRSTFGTTVEFSDIIPPTHGVDPMLVYEQQRFKDAVDEVAHAFHEIESA